MRNRQFNTFAQMPDPLARLDQILTERDERALRRLLSTLTAEEKSEILTALSPQQLKALWSMVPLVHEDRFLPRQALGNQRIE